MTTPTCRTLTVEAESRTLTIPAEVRTLVVIGLTGSTIEITAAISGYWGNSYWGDSYWGGVYWTAVAGAVNVTGTPTERKLTIEAETRTLTIEAENRTLTIPACKDGG